MNDSPSRYTNSEEVPTQASKLTSAENAAMNAVWKEVSKIAADETAAILSGGIKKFHGTSVAEQVKVAEILRRHGVILPKYPR